MIVLGKRVPNKRRKKKSVGGLVLGTDRGKFVKIPADFDTALTALIAVSPKKRRKAGRP